MGLISRVSSRTYRDSKIPKTNHETIIIALPPHHEKMDSEYYHQDAGPTKKPKKKRGWFRKFFSNFTRIFKSDKTRPPPTRTQSFHTRTAASSQTPTNQNSTSN